MNLRLELAGHGIELFMIKGKFFANFLIIIGTGCTAFFICFVERQRKMEQNFKNQFNYISKRIFFSKNLCINCRIRQHNKKNKINLSFAVQIIKPIIKNDI